MSRFALFGLLTGFFLVAGTTSSRAVSDPESQEKKVSAEEIKVREQRERIGRQIDLSQGIDSNTPLKDALEFLSDRYDLTIIIDSKAFETIGVPKVEDHPVSLPKMRGVSIRTVLQMLLGQVKGDAHNGTFLIQGDHLEVTTTLHTNPSAWIGDMRKEARTVHTNIDRLPLEAALRKLAAKSGLNIVLDAKVADKAQKIVTAQVDNVPLDTAVKMLADMADLKSVALDNVLYVTSRENAKVLQQEQAELKKSEKKDEKEGESKPKSDKGTQ